MKILFACFFLSLILINIHAQGSLKPLASSTKPGSTTSSTTNLGPENEWRILYETQKRMLDSLSKLFSLNQNELLKLKEQTALPKDFSSGKNFVFVSWISFCVFIAWILLLLVYYYWAIRYHVVNFGLSGKMWKILYPEGYSFTETGKKKFKKLRREMFQRRAEEGKISAADCEENALDQPFEEPKENPYKNDSFGLPPGTVRGTLALTALVMFLCVEAVNFFSPFPLEHHFEELMLAVQMVLAFYFGSRAVEVFTAGKKQKKEEITSKPLDNNQTTVVAKPDTAAEPVNALAELPQMPSGISGERQIIINEQDKSDTPSHTEGWQISATLQQRVLALTASFETSKGFPDCFGTITGNFDGQGISFGALQWNIKQNSLQPLLRDMLNNFPEISMNILGEDKYDEMNFMLGKSLSEQMGWASGIQYTTTRSNGRKSWTINSDWKEKLQTLGKTKEMISLQVNSSKNYFNKALSNCENYGLLTERGIALMFDIRVQNGSLDRQGVGELIKEDFLKIPASLSFEESETEKMKIVSLRRAAISNPQWRKDVENRKLTIARGSGIVHGKHYDLQKDFNLSLKKYS